MAVAAIWRLKKWSKKYLEHLGRQGDGRGRRGDTWWIFPTFCHQPWPQHTVCLLSPVCQRVSQQLLSLQQFKPGSPLYLSCIEFLLEKALLHYLMTYLRVIWNNSKIYDGDIMMIHIIISNILENDPMRGLTPNLKGPPGRPMRIGAARTNQWERERPGWPPERPMRGTIERQ